MTQTGNITSFYFLGIGGIGMSSLARYFRNLGYRVAGYDRTSTKLTGQLRHEGIDVHFDDLGRRVCELAPDKDSSLVVYTPAVPGDHGELTWFRENGYRIVKRSQLLGMICNSKKCIAVAGTHGKTTISAMVANILHHSAVGCGAFLGGIAKDFGSNLVMPDPEDRWLVTEADEYDHSFLQLTPDIAIVTYMDADHLDVYGDCQSLKESFLRFAAQVRPGGCLVVRKELAAEFPEFPGIRVYTYSLSEDADFSAIGLLPDDHSKCYGFQLKTPSGTTGMISMKYPGLLNVENAVAAGAAAFLAGAEPFEVEKGIETYSGVERRFDVRFSGYRSVYIDDYAHHPAEIKAFISSVRLIYTGKRITGIFQPHLFSRTRDFAPQFAESLDLLDSILLLPIYPARELPLPGVTSELILSYMSPGDKHVGERGQVLDFIRERKPEVLLTMGAGDIDLLAGEISDFLRNEEGF
jgi:UDP-N-acetylmuramate--alanine ligase